MMAVRPGHGKLDFMQQSSLQAMGAVEMFFLEIM